MRVFDHPNTTGGFICPVCGTSDDAPVVLVGIAGTEEGRIIQARQYHLECIDLREHHPADGPSIVYMAFDSMEAGEEAADDPR